MTKQKIGLLFVAILVCFVAAAIGSIFTTPAIPVWYASLIKPSFSPPNWLFGPVWSTLYLLMGIALYLVWRLGWDQKKVRLAVIVFLVHLVINALWSVLFFGLHSPLLGLIGISILWLMIIWLIWRFWSLQRTAAYLLIPYLFWVSFASVLNFSIWWLNS
ncbi:MAG: TspO/MBR family protein [Patescibacteria group bacterium]